MQYYFLRAGLLCEWGLSPLAPREVHSTYTRFFKKFNREDVDNVFGKINKWFFEQISEKTITLDLDSSVITRYGSQEGSLVGYNPRPPGRPSHHPIMAFIADIRMVAHSWLRPGNAGSANGAIIFLSETMDILGKHVIGLLRADAGFFDGKFIDDIESKALEYIIAAKINPVIKGKIQIQPRLQTIRFQCFAIGSWIGKKYRQKVLKVSLAQKRRPWFEGLFAKIDEFSWATAFKT